MARPKKWTSQRRKELLAAFEEYIDSKDIPILAEFAYLNRISRQRLYEWAEFSDAIELCHSKKEANLELGALTRTIDPGMAKFSLHQLGWRERSSQEITGADGGPVSVFVAPQQFKTAEEWEAYVNRDED